MLASGFWRISQAGAVAFVVVAPAFGQHVILDAPGLVPNRSAPLAPVRPAPTVWPRLDPGAVLCNTVDDLELHAANMTARVSGGRTMAADCRIIAQPTGIQIVTRQGQGRTLVKLNVAGDVTGWTDAWLPDKAPAGR
jgi:hypothetical protein